MTLRAMTADEVTRYRDHHGVGAYEARNAIQRRILLDAVVAAETLGDLKAVMTVMLERMMLSNNFGPGTT